jgi:hypothetical protein
MTSTIVSRAGQAKMTIAVMATMSTTMRERDCSGVSLVSEGGTVEERDSWPTMIYQCFFDLSCFFQTVCAA